MNTHIENTLSTFSRPVALVKTGKPWPVTWIADMKNIMTAHGGNLVEHDDHCMFYFPDQTIKRLILPSSQSDHWAIILPDGFRVTMHGLPNGGWTLTFPFEAFSPEIQAKYFN